MNTERSVTLTRSKRKTVALYVRDGKLEVRAPLNMPKIDIDRFVASKEKWIADKLKKSEERLVRRESFSLCYGDTVLYRGNRYPVEAKSGAGFDGTAFLVPPGLSSEEIKAACAGVYRTLARRDLTARVLKFAERMNVTPSAVKITGAKTRWGSCSQRGSVNFSWRLMMGSDDVIDYVVVHELAHLTEMNHSAGFWSIVEGVLPDYRDRKNRLGELHRACESWG